MSSNLALQYFECNSFIIEQGVICLKRQLKCRLITAIPMVIYTNQAINVFNQAQILAELSGTVIRRGPQSQLHILKRSNMAYRRLRRDTNGLLRSIFQDPNRGRIVTCSVIGPNTRLSKLEATFGQGCQHGCIFLIMFFFPLN